MKLAFSVAVRFLKSNKSQTIFISLGIAVGVSVQIFIGLLIQGLQKDLIDTTIGNTSQITVFNAEEQDISEYPELVEIIENTDNRIINILPILDRAVFIEKDGKSRSVLMRGIDLEISEGIYGINEKIIFGVLPYEMGKVIIGRETSEELGIDIGDLINILNTEGNRDSLEVSDIFDLGISNLNRAWIVSTMETVGKIYGLGDVSSAIEMQIDDVFAAKEAADNLAKELGSGYTVTNWQDQNQELLSGLNGQSISSLMIQIFVMIAVVLGIASVLAISVIQKSRQIGILKAMGIKDRQASLIFLFQGIILGTMGALMGIILGSALLVMFTTFAKNPDGTSIIEITYKLGFIALSGIIAVFAAVTASLIPARRSSKLSPIEVIRNG